LSWALPLLDFLCAAAVLLAVLLAAGAGLFPALPAAPLLVVLVFAAIGAYGSRPADDGRAWPVIRVLVGGLFAWVAALLTPLGTLEQLVLWAGFAVVDPVARALAEPALRRLEPVERWLLVGDEATAARLRGFAPLRAHAVLVAAVPPLAGEDREPARLAALDLTERFRPDRVVIGGEDADDAGLLRLVRAFKSIGVPVSLLPRPLDLLEAPAATPSQVGGVPLIEVEALAAGDAVPYTGPDRRRERRTKISVVVPAKNEARNVGRVLAELPDGLHEVILVDARSTDDTVEVARRARPDVRVRVQRGNGKGDALRTGFAAATGNLIVMLDADGSADPTEIPRFVAALEAGADFAKGSRFLPGGGSADITPTRRLGNAVLSGSANALHGTHFTDLCYGYNAFWARCLPFISLDVPGFEVETLINLRIADAGMRIKEVPSFERERFSGQSNLKAFRDGSRVLATIVREARRRRSLRPDRPRARRRPAPLRAGAVAP
jgi:hypothetical protein